MTFFAALRLRPMVLFALLLVLVASGCAASGSVQGRGSENSGGGRAKVGFPF